MVLKEKGKLVMSIALITGITGQDGSYLAKFLLDKGYIVHGLKRRSSSFNTSRLDAIYKDPHVASSFFLHYGDLNESSNLFSLINKIKPTEIYNLAAQSHVRVSFDTPEYTGDVDALGVVRILEAIRQLDPKIRFYQASSSEMYGCVQEVPQTEKTPFYPRSPYGVAKVYGYWITVNYREAYGLHASNGILFNHESPLRGETFVTRKITRAAARIKTKLDDCLYLGNLDAQRDWGHAKDYVEAMWLMTQHDTPDDYVVASGRTIKIRDFVRIAFSYVGIPIEFHGSGLDEIGIDVNSGKTILRIDARYYRPSEVDLLLGDATKAKTILGWSPRITVEDMCKEMVDYDLTLIKG